MIVVDASAIIEILLRTELGHRVAARLYDEVLVAPSHYDLEVLSGLRTLAFAGQHSMAHIESARLAFADLRVQAYPHKPFLDRVWELRNNITTYDATYIALAEWFRVPFITCDRKVANAPGHGAKIELFA